ncbi:MAG: TetR/AcrR family transcriptional regulator [Marmoricola sp.]
MTTEQRPLRADAQRNLERICASARTLFAERGAKAQMEDIAAHAGVGVGTLYRRFPTKESLMTSLVRERFAEFAEIGADVENTCSPDVALETLVRRQCEAVENDAAFQLAMMSIDSFDWAGIEEVKVVLHEIVTRIIARGQEAGAVRADLKADDFGTMMCAITATMYFMHEPGDWRRQLEITLAGLRPA